MKPLMNPPTTNASVVILRAACPAFYFPPDQRLGCCFPQLLIRLDVLTGLPDQQAA